MTFNPQPTSGGIMLQSMKAKLTKIAYLIVILTCVHVLGCKTADIQERAVQSCKTKKDIYEKWLIQQRPFIAELPETIVFDREICPLVTRSRFWPIVTYYLKAGNWDGVLEVKFILNLDRNDHPVSIDDEWVYFIRLPLESSTTDKEGKVRNHYSCLRLSEMEGLAAIMRAVAGGNFDDLMKKASESADVSHAPFETFDRYKHLPKK